VVEDKTVSELAKSELAALRDVDGELDDPRDVKLGETVDDGMTSELAARELAAPPRDVRLGMPVADGTSSELADNELAASEDVDAGFGKLLARDDTAGIPVDVALGEPVAVEEPGSTLVKKELAIWELPEGAKLGELVDDVSA
jgi:hypothetical protein